ncbi:MAG: hypothetical protein Q9187_007581 [Circinaria calcarea]
MLLLQVSFLAPTRTLHLQHRHRSTNNKKIHESKTREAPPQSHLPDERLDDDGGQRRCWIPEQPSQREDAGCLCGHAFREETSGGDKYPGQAEPGEEGREKHRGWVDSILAEPSIHEISGRAEEHAPDLICKSPLGMDSSIRRCLDDLRSLPIREPAAK